MLDRIVLKEHQMYLVCDGNGDIAAHNIGGHGLYSNDTRHLSLFSLEVEGTAPQLLSSNGEFSFMTNLQFSNMSFRTFNGEDVQERTLSIRRNRFLSGALHERLGFYNYNQTPVEFDVTLMFGSDFRDMFDVRGYAPRSSHGALSLSVESPNAIVLGYSGLDHLQRRTVIEFDQEPLKVDIVEPSSTSEEPITLPGISGAGDPRTEIPIRPPTARVTFRLAIAPNESRAITFQIVPVLDGAPAQEGAESLDNAFRVIRDSYKAWEEKCTTFTTDHEIFNAVVERSLHDLRLLSEETPDGYLPSAGIPWFSVPFGRDSLITALETLSLQPKIARATLCFLAEHQGKEVNDWRDEQPGKIIHEIRRGEMARLGQVPHGPFYGSVDATPLFLITLGEYLRWTDDWELGRQLRPNVEAALDWIDTFGDLDDDGFVEYLGRSERGNRHHGWKDSAGAICHEDGRPARQPIALAEVQGYVYAAQICMADYFDVLGDPSRAETLRQQASTLRTRFHRDWWIESEDCFAMALDAEKTPLSVVSSNPGHCLWAGMLDRDHAARLARRLARDDMLSGWGIRSLSSKTQAFNPMTYHRGSVWPHENAMIVQGLRQYGHDELALQVAEEIVDAAVRLPLYRVPELYCGFARDRQYFSMPATYPTSCSPQAWSAGSVFLLMQAMLGLRVDAATRTLHLRPVLIPILNQLQVRRLRVGDELLDFNLVRGRDSVHVEIVDSGSVNVVVERAKLAVGTS